MDFAAAFEDELGKIAGASAIGAWAKRQAAKAHDVLFSEKPGPATEIAKIQRVRAETPKSLKTFAGPKPEPAPEPKWERIRMARTGPTKAVSPTAKTKRLPVIPRGHVVDLKKKKFSKTDVASLLSEEGLEHGASSFLDELGKIAAIAGPPLTRLLQASESGRREMPRYAKDISALRKDPAARGKGSQSHETLAEARKGELERLLKKRRS